MQISKINPILYNTSANNYHQNKLVARSTDEQDIGSMTENCKSECTDSICTKTCDLTAKFFTDHKPQLEKCAAKCTADSKCANQCTLEIFGIDETEYQASLKVSELMERCTQENTGSDQIYSCIGDELNLDSQTIHQALTCVKDKCISADTLEILTQCSTKCQTKLYNAFTDAKKSNSSKSSTSSTETKYNSTPQPTAVSNSKSANSTSTSYTSNSKNKLSKVELVSVLLFVFSITFNLAL